MRRLIPLIFLALVPLSLGGCAHSPSDYADLPMDYFVFFETNSAELTPDGYAIIQRAADAIGKLRPQGVIVSGYSDRVGSEAANHQISSHRTQLVEKTLVDIGVDATIITSLPLGPARDNLGPTGDRRIEIRLIKDSTGEPGPANTHEAK